MLYFLRDINLLLKHGSWLTLRDISLTCHGLGHVPCPTWVLFLNIYIFFLSTWAVNLRVDFWRNYQSFWENMFKAELKNGSNFIICFIRKKFFFELVFHSFIPKPSYRFSAAQFRLLRHCFPAFCRVDQLYGSWNVLFPELKKFLDYEINIIIIKLYL